MVWTIFRGGLAGGTAPTSREGRDKAWELKKGAQHGDVPFPDPRPVQSCVCGGGGAPLSQGMAGGGAQHFLRPFIKFLRSMRGGYPSPSSLGSPSFVSLPRRVGKELFSLLWLLKNK